MKFTGILLLLVLGNFMGAHAQTVTGKVFALNEKKQKEPLPYVTVNWIHTSVATFSDEKGEFTIPADKIKDKRLVFTLVGYKSDTLQVTGLTPVEMTLALSAIVLDGAEVVGKEGNAFISSMDPKKIQVITSTELRRAACCNLSESFETNASVDVMFSDAITGAKQIQLLGLSGVYSQVISENVPLIRGLGSTFGLNYIPGPWMQSISVAKGASSVINGFESTTGQINVEYKKPAESEKLFLNLFGNSHGRLEANAYSAYKFNDKLSTMLLGHVSKNGKPFDANGDLFMDIPKLTTYNFLNRWDYMTSSYDSRLLVKYLDETRIGGYLDFDPDTYSDPSDESIENHTATYGLKIRTQRLESFWKNGIVFGDQASVALIVSGIYHNQDGFFGINKYKGEQKSFYSNLLYSDALKSNPNHKFTAGLSFMYDLYSENYFRRDFTYLYQELGIPAQDASPDTLFAIYSQHDTTYVRDRKEVVPGAFLEYTWTIPDKFTLIAGLRVDHHNTFGTFVTPRLHVRYKPIEVLTLRASAGKGYRTANVFSENYSVLASQRLIHFSDELGQEKAWNYGINATYDFKLFSRAAQLDLEFYRTDFQNQVITDLDSLPEAVYFYNLNGQSYANSYMVQLTVEPLKRFTVLLAYRVSDVKVTENGVLREKAMVNHYKGLVTLGYATKFDKWKFDVTTQFIGKARIPDTDQIPPDLQRPGYSPSYIQLLAQVTRKFKYFEVYLGGENLTNFTQKDPVTESHAPYHTHFDTSMVWGPIVGASVYAGLRWSLK